MRKTQQILTIPTIKPPRIGAVLAETVLRKDGGITITEFAKILHVSRGMLSRVINGHTAVSEELAIRLSLALGYPAQRWLNLQNAYNLYQAGKKRRPQIALLPDNCRFES